MSSLRSYFPFPPILSRRPSITRLRIAICPAILGREVCPVGRPVPRTRLRNPGLRFAAGFGFAWLRYGLYSIQYYAILRFYGIDLPLDAALAGVGSIYLLQTAIPLPPVLALLARGEIALLIWGIWGANALSILAASYTLFVLNLAFPALLGLFYIVKKW